VQRVWTEAAGGGDDVLRLGLAPAADGETVYIAGSNGRVRAVALATGKTLWSVDTELSLAGGPGVGHGLVVIGSGKGEVVALEAATGARRWRTDVRGEVLSAPAVGQDVIAVRTTDGRLRGLRAADGGEIWVYEQPVPRLSLRGTAAPVIAGDTVICGFDNGKVAAIDLARGDQLWESAVNPPKGKTELERLSDIDAAVVVADRDVFIAGFQGRTAMLAIDSGQAWWSRELSSHHGVTVDDTNLYVTAADGAVVALRRRDGTEVWRQSALLNRGLTGPALDGNAVVVADFEGYVHWLDRETGAIAARESAGGGRITNAPVAAGGLVLVQSDAGKVFAFRSRPRG
jgi:outer membrane protein assembly factor BamB